MRSCMCVCVYVWPPQLRLRRQRGLPSAQQPWQLSIFSPLTRARQLSGRARVDGRIEQSLPGRRPGCPPRSCASTPPRRRPARAPPGDVCHARRGRSRSAAGGARCAVCWRTASRTRPSTTEQGRVLHTDGPSRRPESGRVRPSGPLERRTSASRGRHKRCGESQVCCLSV